ncbi:MAG: hypothetical protein ACE37F_18945 [Nannocystaceae bacterium]|nr:hypothetical protein [bacterium]
MDARTQLDTLRDSVRTAARVSEELDQAQRVVFVQGWLERVDLAVWENGAGDRLSVLLGTDWGIVAGFDHESPWSPWFFDEAEEEGMIDGLLDGMPAPQLDCLNAHMRGGEDKFRAAGLSAPLREDEITCCVWLPPGRQEWTTGVPRVPEHRDDWSTGGRNWLIEDLPWGPEWCAVEEEGPVLERAREIFRRCGLHDDRLRPYAERTEIEPPP